MDDSDDDEDTTDDPEMQEVIPQNFRPRPVTRAPPAHVAKDEVNSNNLKPFRQDLDDNVNTFMIVIDSVGLDGHRSFSSGFWRSFGVTYK